MLVSSQSDRRAAAGPLVSVSQKSRLSPPTGVYNLMRALPASTGSAPYQIKSHAGPFGRIIDEDGLSAVDHTLNATPAFS